jgi:hypothetical protein
MIRSELDLPCMEASRCFLTDKERGLRLSVTPKGKLFFTKNRRDWEEWHYSIREETVSGRRHVCFRSVAHGHFLNSTPDGMVGASESPIGSQWKMEPSEQDKENTVNDQHRRQDAADLFVLHSHAHNTIVGVDVEGNCSTHPEIIHEIVWEMEFTSGELCFLSNPATEKRIRCNAVGKLTLSKYWMGWEIFRFIEVGNSGHLCISSWTHTSKVLSSDPDGNVGMTENRLGHWEKWQVQKAPTGDGVLLQSVAHGRVLSIQNGMLHTTTKTKGPNAKWHLEAAHQHTYYLTCPIRNRQVASNKTGAMTTRHRKHWEEWKIERSSNGYFTFYSVAHQKYLGSSSNGTVHTTTRVGEWAMWDIEESPHAPGSIFIKSHEHQQHFACDEHGQLYTSDKYGESETWTLEPRLPLSLSGPQLAALGAAGTFGVALAVAVPFALVGIVEAAGLTATEITVAGAAAGVSAEALLGMGGGALLGVGVVGTSAALLNLKGDLNTEVKEESVISSLRPISAWRNW